MVKAKQFLILILIALLSACEADEMSNDQNDSSNKYLSDVADTLTTEPVSLEIRYQLLAVSDTLNWLESLPDSILESILVINHIDRKYLSSMDTLVVPDTLSSNLNLYCPFPEFMDSLKEINKIIYVSRFAQDFAAYKNGKRVHWGPVSTGKETTKTDKGLFSTNWKRKVNISSVNSSWILNWSFNIDNGSGVSFHEYALPGYPASHSCARMYAHDAEWVYYWADQWIMGEVNEVIAFGTPVIIFDDYPFGEQRPWLRLATDPKANEITPEKLWLETIPYYELLYDRQKTRVWILMKKEEEKLAEEKAL